MEHTHISTALLTSPPRFRVEGDDTEDVSMSSDIRCFSQLANLRCTNLSPSQYIGPFVPHALGVLWLPGLVLAGYKTRRATILFLGLDIALQVGLATWDLVCRLRTPIPLDKYRIEDIALAISSVLPTLFLLLGVTSLLLADLRQCLPGRCRSMISTQLFAVLFIPLIPATLILGDLGSFWGIQYTLTGQGRGTIRMEFKDVYDDWLHIVLSDAAAITASVYLLLGVLLAMVVVLHPQSAGRWKLDLGPIQSLQLVGGGMLVAAVEIILGVIPDAFALILARNILRLLSRAAMGAGFAWAYIGRPITNSDTAQAAPAEKTGGHDRARPIRGRISAPVPIPSFSSSLFDHSALNRLAEDVRDSYESAPGARTKVVNGKEYSYRRAKKNIGSIYAPHRISVQECELSQWPPVARGPHPHVLLQYHHPPEGKVRTGAAMISPDARPAAARISSYLIPRSPTPPRPAQRSMGDTSPLTAPVMTLVVSMSPMATPDSSPGEIRTGEVQRFRTGNFTILTPSSSGGVAQRRWPATQTSHDAVVDDTRSESPNGSGSGSDEMSRGRRDTDPSLAIDPEAASYSSSLSSADVVAPLPVPQETPPQDAIISPFVLASLPPPRPRRSKARQPSTQTTQTASSAYTDASTDIPLFYTEPRQSTASLVSPPPIHDHHRESLSPAHSSLIRFPSAIPRYPSTLPSSPHAAGCPTPPPDSSHPSNLGLGTQGNKRYPSDIQAVLNSLRRLQRDTGLQLEHSRIYSAASSLYSAASPHLEGEDEEKGRSRGEVREVRDSLTTISEGSTPLASAGFNGGSIYRGGMI